MVGLEAISMFFFGAKIELAVVGPMQTQILLPILLLSRKLLTPLGLKKRIISNRPITFGLSNVLYTSVGLILMFSCLNLVSNSGLLSFPQKNKK